MRNESGLRADVWANKGSNVLVFPGPGGGNILRQNLKVKRRTSAVLCVDVVGYTRLMEVNEEETYEKLMRLLSGLFQPRIVEHKGCVVKHTGDGFFATFDIPADGIRCALALQLSLLELNRHEPEDQCIWFRMGLNVCDAIFETHDIYGEGVNTAARLQGYAEPGDIVISEAAAGHVPPDLTVPLADLGELHLKNMTRTVRAFAVRIGSLLRRAASPVRALERLPSIAVLPFASRQLGAAEAYFAEGIVEDVIRALACLRELFVISRSSTLAYMGQKPDVRTVGRELAVRYVLTGTIRRTPAYLRISTELAEAASGTVICAERYDCVDSNLFEIQEHVALRIVAEIAPEVRKWELRRALLNRPQNMDAYDLTLQGLHLLYRLDYKAFSQARGLLQRAIVEDPDYAAPRAYAAHWHVFRVGQGWSPDPRADGVEGGHLAATAIDLDKDNPLALTLRGHTYSFILKRTDIALGYFDRALAASPNCAMAWALSSATHSYLGKGNEAVLQAQHALRLSPKDIHAFYYQTALTLAHHACGNYEEAVVSGFKALSENSSFCTNLRHTAASLVALGRLTEAAEITRLHMQTQPDFRLSSFASTCPYSDEQTRQLFIERLRTAGLPD